MKIAQIAPTWFSIPPQGYGGVELIISALTEGLVEKGHDVTLFASGDSRTKAKLISVRDKAPGKNPIPVANMCYEMQYLFNMFLALEEQNEFDLLHWHFGMDISPIMFAALSKTPSVITIHNHFNDNDTAEISSIINHYKDLKYFVSISNSHRKKFPFEYIDTVYNGIDVDAYSFNEKPSDYFVWLGRFEKIKGADVAIQAALKLNKPLKLAAPKDESDYFKQEVEPYLGKNNIEYVGEVNLVEKNQLLGGAIALLSPIDWDEPFGLVVPESNACGTPVVAYSRGAMSEIIKEGINGFGAIAGNIDSLTESIQKILQLSSEEYLDLRKSCRQYVQENFTISKMADGYLEVYKKILVEKGK